MLHPNEQFGVATVATSWNFGLRSLLLYYYLFRGTLDATLCIIGPGSFHPARQYRLLSTHCIFPVNLSAFPDSHDNRGVNDACLLMTPLIVFSNPSSFLWFALFPNLCFFIHSVSLSNSVPQLYHKHPLLGHRSRYSLISSN